MSFMAVGSWFAVEVWNGQKDAAIRSEQRFLELSKQIAALDKEHAIVEASRFTSSDWMKANDVITSRFAAQERRIDKQEDLLQTISASLKKLESALVR